MVSVCLATYNGERYISDQITSILNQLTKEDELIISDDGSTDNTISKIKSFQDRRIKLIFNKVNHGVAKNFENALNNASGDIIFFSDQDDVWFSHKIKKMVSFLQESDYKLVTCNCSMTDENLNIIRENYYEKKSPIDKTVFGNFIKDLWLGCCMAFKKEILQDILPFPQNIAAHDLWIALYSQINYKCGYFPYPLQYYRRHNNTVSFADGKSTNPLSYKIKYRLYLAWYLFVRTIKNRLK